MRLSTTATSLLANFAVLTSSKPIPTSFSEVERRWADGESERDIHPNFSHRDMTPAWPILDHRTSPSDFPIFSAATDARTLKERERAKKTGWRAFVERMVKGRESKEVEEEVMIRPREVGNYLSE
ncbi:hypothetical protein TI39_contig272g00007 [Zymoseptoria brevis]|uniref:Uncharacterized protein n=1 Tax=Zymoseptoria brevis TaxID=1047168 RepID=A0A0F4GY42_9PEZI|nr:hypothetical protein TI39_contig272g00007 [Zymoseptoria brevis]